MNPKCVTYVPAHPLPLSPVYTLPGGEGLSLFETLVSVIPIIAKIIL